MASLICKMPYNKTTSLRSYRDDEYNNDMYIYDTIEAINYIANSKYIYELMISGNK